MRLVANALMRKAHRTLKKAGKLGRGMVVTGPPPVQRRVVQSPKRPPPARDYTDGDFWPIDEAEKIGLAPTGTLEPALRGALVDGVNNLIDGVERAVLRRESLARQAPGPRPHVVQNPGDPTAEWTAKHQGQIAKHVVSRGEVMPVKSHRIKSPIEQTGERFEISEYGALKAFLTDADVAMSGGLRTANWQSTGGGGDRLGGLGNVDQEYRDRLARNQWIEARLPPKVLATAKALVSRELMKPNGTPFSLEDFGAYLLPSVIDRNRRWGVSAGALCLLADTLVALYRVCPIRIRKDAESQKLLEWEGASQ